MLKKPYYVRDGASPVEGCDSCGEHIAICDDCQKEAPCAPDFHNMKDGNLSGVPVRCQWSWPEGWKLKDNRLFCVECME